MLTTDTHPEGHDSGVDQFWTDVQDDVAVARPLPVAAQSVKKTGYLQAVATRWIAPVAVVVGIALAGQSVFRLNLAFPGNDTAIASIGGLRAALSGPTGTDELPAELIAYDEAQYLNFNRGIVRFKDADLLSYASATARELSTGDDLMTPYQLDVLWLTNREIARRGLARPTHLASYEAARESYHAARRDL